MRKSVANNIYTHKERDEMEDARVGYQVAINLWTFQSSLNWNRFNAMLTANSIIIAVIGVLLENENRSLLLQIAPIVGLILCFIWATLMSRGNDYHRYWIYKAGEIENRYFDSLNIVSGAESKEKKERKIRYSWLSRSVFGRSQNIAIYTVILVFAILYFITLLETFLR